MSLPMSRGAEPPHGRETGPLAGGRKGGMRRFGLFAPVGGGGTAGFPPAVCVVVAKALHLCEGFLGKHLEEKDMDVASPRYTSPPGLDQ